jgi:hypothetical protein
MNPFELMKRMRPRDAPFSIPCPHCGSVATYNKEGTQHYICHKSYVAIEVAGACYDADRGTFLGHCCCSNQECQESTHFIGYYSTNIDGEDPHLGSTFREIEIKYFLPSVPLIKLPEKTPKEIAAIIVRAFGPAFFDQAASGHLLRYAIEKLLDRIKVPRFELNKRSKKIRLSLHGRIERLPATVKKYESQLLAIKWIGNAATHHDLEVDELKLLFEIVESLLEDLYGTRRRELLRAIKRVNKRKKP